MQLRQIRYISSCLYYYTVFYRMTRTLWTDLTFSIIYQHIIFQSNSSVLGGRIRQRTGRVVEVGDVGITTVLYTLMAWSTWLYWLYIYIPGDSHWIGGSDRGREGMWRWETSGSRLNYTYWGPGEPNSHSHHGGVEEDCLVMSSHDGRWNDYPCDWSVRYICESVWVCKHKVVHANYAFVN